MYRQEKLDRLLTKADVNKIKGVEERVMLIRSCLNVPLDKEGKITDPARIIEAMPLYRDLISKKAKAIVVMAHLGRPEGVDPRFSLLPIKDYLQSHLNCEVTMLESLNEIDKSDLQGFYLVENIRFFPGEVSKDLDEQKDFAHKLATLGDIFINDAFPDYRESPSTYYVAELLPAYLGPAFIEAVKALYKFSNPASPYIAVLGGAKLSEKIDVLDALLRDADKVLIGGAMAYTLLRSQGYPIGKSLYEPEKLDVAQRIIDKYSHKLRLPVDHVAVEEFVPPSSAEEYRVLNHVEIPEGLMAVDIGPKTVELYLEEIRSANSILWNGPLGVAEWDLVGNETKHIAEAIAENRNVYTLAGGGDSLAAIKKFNISGFDYLSTGGGAMLAFLAYETFSTLDVIIRRFS